MLRGSRERNRRSLTTNLGRNVAPSPGSSSDIFLTLPPGFVCMLAELASIAALWACAFKTPRIAALDSTRSDHHG
jgi:hypothetical protein